MSLTEEQENDELETSEIDDDELVSAWEAKHKIYHYETTTKNLERLIETIGYPSIDDFLEDNPGAQSAIVEWIADWVSKVPDWSANLREDLEE